MNLDEITTAALNLDPQSRARLAGELISSLDNLSEGQTAQLWAEEARRRETELGIDPSQARSMDDVLKNARERLD